MRWLDINEVSRAEGSVLPLDVSVDLSECDPAFADVTLRGEVRNTEGVLSFRAAVNGVCTLPCDRCLEPTELSLSAALDTYMDRNSSEDESVTVEDGRVDLEKTAYDALVLALPYKVLCRPDCLGLCPVCGQNRNQGACACGTESAE